MLALSVQGLTKTYSNNVHALKGIDLKIAEGDFFGLLGQNGAGKSTTIGIISSLINKSAGKVIVFGFDMDTHLNKAKSYISVVPQEMNFNPFEKVLHILVNQAGYYGIPRKIALARAEYYLKKLGIWDKHNQQAMRLSGGMKRRLLIARALIIEPKLLILDEPTAGVDIELRHLLWDFLAELNASGLTIILTTHYLEEAEKLCKNLAIIHQGNIIENATTKHLLQRLPQQTFLLDLVIPLALAPKITGFPSTLIDKQTIEVKIYKHQNLNDLFIELNNLGIKIIGIRNKTNRLEEIFFDSIAQNTENY